jgi:hypothetical protein
MSESLMFIFVSRRRRLKNFKIFGPYGAGGGCNVFPKIGGGGGGGSAARLTPLVTLKRDIFIVSYSKAEKNETQII